MSGYSSRRQELTPRMVDVLECTARGLTAYQTGRELRIAAGTVKVIRGQACARLGAPNLYAAVAIYARGERS